VDIEHLAGIVAADREPAGARAFDVQVFRDLQRATHRGQRDGARDTTRERDGVPGTGTADRVAQRSHAAIVRVGDKVDIEQGSIFHDFEQGTGRPAAAKSRPPAGAAALAEVIRNPGGEGS